MNTSSRTVKRKYSEPIEASKFRSNEENENSFSVTEQSNTNVDIYNITSTGPTDLSIHLHLGFGDIYTSLRNQDLHCCILEECINFAFDNYFFSGDNYTVIADVNKLATAKVNFNELSKPIENSMLYHYFVTENKGCCYKQFHDCDGSLLDRTNLYSNICFMLYPKLQHFSDNLLNLLDNEKKNDLKYHQLFISFAQICGLKIFDESDTPYPLKCNQKITSSFPDALVKSYGICKDTDGSHLVSKVVAIVRERPAINDIKVYGSKTNGSSHYDDKHIGDMLAVIQSGQSLFGFRGIYGLLIEAMKVTIVYYKGSEEYFQQVYLGKPTLTAEVFYSNPLNILSRDGRKTLVSVLLDIDNFTKREMHRRWHCVKNQRCSYPP